MLHLFHYMTCVTLIAILLATSTAQDSKKSRFAEELSTIAGVLRILEQEPNCRYDVVLDRKTIWHTDCHDASSTDTDMPIPTIHTYYKQGVKPFPEVILMQQQMLGNACNGGPLWFIGLRQDGSYALSHHIAFCGGRQPVVTWSEDKVTVVLPGGPPNRGTGFLPTVTWVYEDGQVRRTTAPKRQK